MCLLAFLWISSENLKHVLWKLFPGRNFYSLMNHCTEEQQSKREFWGSYIFLIWFDQIANRQEKKSKKVFHFKKKKHTNTPWQAGYKSEWFVNTSVLSEDVFVTPSERSTSCQMQVKHFLLLHYHSDDSCMFFEKTRKKPGGINHPGCNFTEKKQLEL